MRRGLIIGALAATALAGCGGGGDDSRLSAKDYRAKASQICAETQRETNALGRPKRTSEFKVFLARGLKVTDRSLQRFAALKPPKDLEDEHNAIVSGERAAQDELRALSTKLHGDSRDIEVLRQAQPQLSKIGDETNARYRAAGLTACARG
jgi:hypothetical protein